MSRSDAVPGTLADVAEWVRGVDWSALDSDELKALIVQLESVSRALQAGCAAGCAEFASRERRAGRSAGSAASSIGQALGVPAGQARNRCEAGARQSSTAGQASAHGQIAPAQEAVIAEAVGRLPDSVTAEQRDEFETALVDDAKDGAWTGRLNATARKRLYALAPRVAVADEAEQQRRRDLRAAPADQQGMSVITVNADPVLRGLLDAAIAKFGQPGTLVSGDAENDQRSPGQRAHDALGHVLRLGLASQESSDTGVATIVVSVTPEQLDAIYSSAEFGSAIDEGSGHGGAAELVETNCGSTMSARQALGLAGRRSWFISCLAEGRQELRRVDVDANPTRRLATALQRLVLYAAHGGCTHPGCDRPAARCQAHHVRDHSRGGPTIVSNLALVCPTHHGWAGHSSTQWRTRPDPGSPGKPRWVPPDGYVRSVRQREGVTA